MLFHKVPEFLRPLGQVVDHKIRHNLIVPGNRLNILPGAKLRGNPAVINGGKAPVPGGGVERQDVHSTDFLGEIGMQHMIQLLQVLAEAVGIGDEHDVIFHSCLPFLFQN